MKQKNLFLKLLMVAVAVTMTLSAVALVAGANTSSDPLVTLSYLNGTYKENLLSQLETEIAAAEEDIRADVSRQVSALEAAVANQTPAPAENDFEVMKMTASQTIILAAGGEVLFLSGSVVVDTVGLVNASTGNAVPFGGSLAVNNLYVATAQCELRASADAELLVK